MPQADFLKSVGVAMNVDGGSQAAVSQVGVFLFFVPSNCAFRVFPALIVAFFSLLKTLFYISNVLNPN